MEYAFTTKLMAGTWIKESKIRCKCLDLQGRRIKLVLVNLKTSKTWIDMSRVNCYGVSVYYNLTSRASLHFTFLSHNPSYLFLLLASYLSTPIPSTHYTSCFRFLKKTCGYWIRHSTMPQQQNSNLNTGHYLRNPTISNDAEIVIWSNIVFFQYAKTWYN